MSYQILQVSCLLYLLILWKPQKNLYFNGPATKALPPSPLDSATFFWDFFYIFKKSYFFLSGLALTPRPPSGRATKKITFLRLHLIVYVFKSSILSFQTMHRLDPRDLIEGRLHFEGQTFQAASRLR